MPTSRCPPADQLERLLEEQLDDASCQAVARHVDSCAVCQAALEGLPGAAVAERLGRKVAHVFVAKSEVQKMLAEEVRRLEAADPH